MRTIGRSSAPARMGWLRPAGQGGLSLLEVLTASLVLAVGVSGLAALEAGALRDGREALQRTEAVVLAADLLDRVRANPAGDYRTAFGEGPPGAACIVRDCGPDELAAFDVATWKCRLGTWTAAPTCAALRGAGALLGAEQPGLPEGDGRVAVGADGQVRVTVAWRVGTRLRREVAVASRI